MQERPCSQREQSKTAGLPGETLAEALGLSGAELGVGIGIHCGELSFGEFGRSHRDLTAIGTVVNLASRAQSAAAAGEILVTQAVHERAQSELAASRVQELELKVCEGPPHSTRPESPTTLDPGCSEKIEQMHPLARPLVALLGSGTTSGVSPLGAPKLTLNKIVQLG